MKRIHKLLALVLALVMTLSLGVIGAEAKVADNGTGDMKNVNLNGTLTISGTATYESLTIKNGGELILTRNAKVTADTLKVEDGGTVQFVSCGAGALTVNKELTVGNASFEGNSKTDAAALTTGTDAKVNVTGDTAKETMKKIADPATDAKVDGTTITTYTVTAAATTGGAFTVGPTSAAEGATVTITITPDSGYALDTVSTTPSVTLSGTDNTRTFTMPASDVTVTVTFKQTPTVRDVTNLTYGDLFPANRNRTALTAPAIDSEDEVGAVIEKMVREGKTSLELQYPVGQTAEQVGTLQNTALAFLMKYEGQLGLNTAVGSRYWTDGKVEMSGFAGRYDAAGNSDYAQLALAAAKDVYNQLHSNGAIPAGASQTDIAKAYYEYLCKHVEYVNDGNLCFTSYGALVNGKAVCQGYTSAYNLLLALEGIEAYGYEVPDYPGEGGHIRTVATLDGKQVCIDVTWGDPVNGDGSVHWEWFDIDNWNVTAKAGTSLPLVA